MNPVRSGMVDHPAKYRWSSYAAKALGITNVILNPHDEYLNLDKTPMLRQQVYQGLFAVDEEKFAIRNAVG